MLSEMVTVSRAEYDRLRRAKAEYTERYERLAAEMRRKINMAQEQLEVATREIKALQERIAELKTEGGTGDEYQGAKNLSV